jgi:hypothetical protein
MASILTSRPSAAAAAIPAAGQEVAILTTAGRLGSATYQLQPLEPGTFTLTDSQGQKACSYSPAERTIACDGRSASTFSIRSGKLALSSTTLCHSNGTLMSSDALGPNQACGTAVPVATSKRRAWLGTDCCVQRLLCDAVASRGR